MLNSIMNVLLQCDLLLLTGLILSGLVGGVLGAMVSRPLVAMLRDAAGFVLGATMGAGVFGAVMWVVGGG